MDAQFLKDRFASLKAEATRLAGGLLDIPRRVSILRHLHRDSCGNHCFPLIAAHGALWALGYFEVGGKLGRFIANRYYFSPKERAFRLGLLDQFAEGFRVVNRQVCIDTYTNYYFTREFGESPGAETLVPTPLLEALNTIHAARRKQQTLPEAERRRVFEQSFLCEQEVTVAPGVEVAVKGFECRIMKFLCLRPLVRFAYFPECRYLFFNNFADRGERIFKGMQAFDMARRSGWHRVNETLRTYGVLSPREFEQPDEVFAEIRTGMSGPPLPSAG